MLTSIHDSPLVGVGVTSAPITLTPVARPARLLPSLALLLLTLLLALISPVIPLSDVRWSPVIEVSADAAGDFDLYVPTKPPASGCSWFQSHACTVVRWQVPTKTVAATSYDLTVLDDIRTTTKYTGSRLCKRWFTDFHCRAKFPLCENESKQYKPCLSECIKLRDHCPALGLDCASYGLANAWCKKRVELGLTDDLAGFTIKDQPFDLN